MIGEICHAIYGLEILPDSDNNDAWYTYIYLC